MDETGQLKQALICSSAGAISGAISRTVTSPLDVIKIRFQIQMEPTSSWALLRRDLYGPSKYTGILQASKAIFREEGLSGFWRGNVPALMLYMPYAAIQFTVLQYLKTLAAGSSKQEDHLQLNPYLSYFSGAFAGCAATIGSYPFDLLRTVLASQGEPKVYPTMRSALFDIIKTRGVRGLYAGLSPTLVEIIPYAGLQFGSYDTFKHWMMAWNRYRFSNIGPIKPDDSLSSFQLILCGFAAGTCAKAICHPLDVVKKRFQGDLVEEFQRLCEVQSDKATIEITSRFKGKVVQMLYVPGDIVKVGETLVKIQVDDSQTSFTSEGDINITSGGICLTDSNSPISPKAEASGGVLSTPAVRNLAKELGLVLNDIPGTGKDGRILKEDVLTYAKGKGLCKEQSFSSDSIDGHTNELELLNQDKGFYEDDDVQHEDKIIPVRGFQRSMVKSMTMAAKVPHFHYVEEINFDALVELKAAFQTANKDQNVKHTYLPFLIKSLSMALNKYPLLNSSFNDETNEIILKGYHNIGIAMATPYGLVVPNIKKVQSLTILEITKELARLQQMASSNKLNTEDITGGTLTLSNIGAVGGKFGSPLLNLPEVAIIAIGQIRRLPRFDDDDNIYPASVASVTVGADHRIVDGATVARFCNEWKLLIEKPELLLLHTR